MNTTHTGEKPWYVLGSDGMYLEVMITMCHLQLGNLEK